MRVNERVRGCVEREREYESLRRECVRRERKRGGEGEREGETHTHKARK